MRGIIFRVALCLALPLVVKATILPKAVHYTLSIQVFPKNQHLKAQVELHLQNPSKEPITDVPILLYRLLDITKITDPSGKDLKWDQHVIRMEGEPTWQVNSANIRLNSSISPGDSTVIHISYEGEIFGYSEVMAYTRERIGEDFTLLRNDVLAYPTVAKASRASLMTTYGDQYTYLATVVVPSNMLVACGGIREKVESYGDTTTYAFRNKVPVGRIDIACAPLTELADPAASLTVYHRPSDSAGARRVLRSMKDALDLFTKIFGPTGGDFGYTVIEIPDGWGSQAGPYYALQTSSAFTDSMRIGELWHEIGHSWNARAEGDVQRCRYFDEAFASYFECLAIREFRGEVAYRTEMESNRKYFLKSIERDPRGLTTPVTGYGKLEIGGLSYTKGAWSLYVLHQAIGDEQFCQLIRQMIAEYSDQPISFESFRALAEKVSGKKLTRFFDEWIFGAASSEMLQDSMSINSLVARY